MILVTNKNTKSKTSNNKQNMQAGKQLTIIVLALIFWRPFSFR